MPEMWPLSQMLEHLKEKHGVNLYASNLAKKVFVGLDGEPESVLDQLARDGLARTAEHGRRRRWEISTDAIPRLKGLVRQARPGPRPGVQVTLDAEQVAAFARALARSSDPASAIRQALKESTQWDDETVARIERVIIPVEPRRVPIL